MGDKDNSKAWRTYGQLTTLGSKINTGMSPRPRDAYEDDQNIPVKTVAVGGKWLCHCDVFLLLNGDLDLVKRAVTCLVWAGSLRHSVKSWQTYFLWHVFCQMLHLNLLGHKESSRFFWPSCHMFLFLKKTLRQQVLSFDILKKTCCFLKEHAVF